MARRIVTFIVVAAALVSIACNSTVTESGAARIAPAELDSLDKLVPERYERVGKNFYSIRFEPSAREAEVNSEFRRLGLQPRYSIKNRTDMRYVGDITAPDGVGIRELLQLPNILWVSPYYNVYKDGVLWAGITPFTNRIYVSCHADSGCGDLIETAVESLDGGIEKISSRDIIFAGSWHDSRRSIIYSERINKVPGLSAQPADGWILSVH